MPNAHLRKPFGFAAHPKVNAPEVVVRTHRRGAIRYQEFEVPVEEDRYVPREEEDKPERKERTHA